MKSFLVFFWNLFRLITFPVKQIIRLIPFSFGLLVAWLKVLLMLVSSQSRKNIRTFQGSLFGVFVPPIHVFLPNMGPQGIVAIVLKSFVKNLVHFLLDLILGKGMFSSHLFKWQANSSQLNNQYMGFKQNKKVFSHKKSKESIAEISSSYLQK